MIAGRDHVLSGLLITREGIACFCVCDCNHSWLEAALVILEAVMGIVTMDFSGRHAMEG